MLRLDVALAHSTSQSSLGIIESIINGEIDGIKLAELADKRCKKSKTELAKALTGNIKATDLFQLKQCYRIYQNLLEELNLLDSEIEKFLKIEAQKNNSDLMCPKTKKKLIETSLNIQLRTMPIKYLKESILIQFQRWDEMPF